MMHDEHLAGVNTNAFAQFAGFGWCCKTRVVANETSDETMSKVLVRDIFRTGRPGECEQRCIADVKCAFFSEWLRFSSCVLCSGCVLSLNGNGRFYTSYRKLNHHVASPAVSRPPSLVVISALASLAPSYLNVMSLLQTHFNDSSTWHCSVNAYSRFGIRSNDDSGSNGSEAELGLFRAAAYISTRCQTIECVGCSIGRIWQLTKPDKLAKHYEYLFHLQDDVLLAATSFDISEMLATARMQRLDVASPAVIGATWGSIMGPDECSCERTELNNWLSMDQNVTSTRSQKPAIYASCRSSACHAEEAARLARLNRGCVRREPFLESYALLFTPAAWACYHAMMNLLSPEQTDRLNGWGYDLCFPSHCQALANQAVILSQIVVHEPSRSASATSWFVGRRLSRSSSHMNTTDGAAACASRECRRSDHSKMSQKVAASKELSALVEARTGFRCISTNPSSRARRLHKTCLLEPRVV